MQRLSVHLIGGNLQENEIDCGVLAIAHAVEFCDTQYLDIQISPGKIEWQFQSGNLLREHLVKCLELKRMTPFPIFSTDFNYHVYHDQVLMECPICHWSNFYDKMVECALCKKWLHCKCVHYISVADESENWLCAPCIASTEHKRRTKKPEKYQ